MQFGPGFSIGISGFSQGGGIFANTVRGLCQSANAATGRREDMASGDRPTISASGSEDGSLTQVYNFAASGALQNQDKITPVGGRAVVYASGNMGLKATTVISGGNIGTPNNQVMVAADFALPTGDTVEVRIFPQNEANVRFLVAEDGGPFRYVLANGGLSALVTPTTTTSFKLVFPSVKAGRLLRVELDAGGIIARIRLPAGQTLGTAPAQERCRKMAVYGDSFGGSGAAPDFALNGFGPRLSDLLGLEHNAPSLGGTGYVTATASAANAQDRTDDLLICGADYFDLVLIEHGTNDINNAAAVRAAALLTFQRARTRCPRAIFGVIGPWDAEAPSAMSANRAAARDAIALAVSDFGGAAAGCYFIDMTGVHYTKVDGLHPDTAGAVTLAAAINAKIRSQVLRL